MALHEIINEDDYLLTAKNGLTLYNPRLIHTILVFEYNQSWKEDIIPTKEKVRLASQKLDELIGYINKKTLGNLDIYFKLDYLKKLDGSYAYCSENSKEEKQKVIIIKYWSL